MCKTISAKEYLNILTIEDIVEEYDVIEAFMWSELEFKMSSVINSQYSKGGTKDDSRRNCHNSRIRAASPLKYANMINDVSFASGSNLEKTEMHSLNFISSIDANKVSRGVIKSDLGFNFKTNGEAIYTVKSFLT